MKRRSFIKSLPVATAGLAASRLAGAQSRVVSDDQQAPNVVYVFSDTHRGCSMSFTETPGVMMPGLERMQQRGMQFSHCFSNIPICTPYRAMLQTGGWPMQQGIIANHMKLEGRTDGAERGMISHMFRDAGYSTYYVGKWHLGRFPEYDHGYDRFFLWQGEDNTRMNYVEDGGPSQEWTPDAGYTGVPAKSPHPAMPDHKFKAIGETDQALQCIDDHMSRSMDREKPFFLTLSLHDPHGPWNNIPPHLLDLYRSERDLPFRGNDRLRDWNFNSHYHAEISGVDEQLGRLMAKLEEHGLIENTIVVYTSDHGGMGGAQGVGGGSKRRPFDESCRVPFLLQWPAKIAAGLTLDTLFSTVDIFPTLCGLAGLPERLARQSSSRATESLDYLQSRPGRDLSGDILERRKTMVDSVFVMHLSDMTSDQALAPMHRTIITPEFTYAVMPRHRPDENNAYRWYETPAPWCLFDRQKDPLQLHNLVDDPAHAQIRELLHTRLLDWIATAETPYADRCFARMPSDVVEKWNREHRVEATASREAAREAYDSAMEGLA